MPFVRPLSCSRAEPRPSTRHASTWLSTLALMVLVCFLDSRQVAARFAYGQWLASALMLVYFVWMYREAPPRLRALMKYGVLVATVGEVLFALVVGMYEYRLANVPIYVPPGHAILYGAVYYFVREPIVARHRHLLAPMLMTLGVAYAVAWFMLARDAYGMICTLLFVTLIARSDGSRLFFATMFLFVAYLEQLGTRFGAWAWPGTLLGKFAFFQSGNPPSGISVFYFGFDVACMLAYLLRRKQVRLRFARVKAALAERSPSPWPSPEGRGDNVFPLPSGEG